MKIIYGVTRPTEGEMFWEGEAVDAGESRRTRAALGIGMVFQHFSLFETLTVVENVALALPGAPDLGYLARRIEKVSEKYGLPVDPRRLVHALSVGERQRVEIIRCLLQNPKLLIMDEPTSVLTPQAVRKLFETLRQLAAEGCSILYISHKLDEIQELCHTATVLRGGQGDRHLHPVAGDAEVDGADDDRQGPAGAASTARRRRAARCGCAWRGSRTRPTIRSAPISRTSTSTCTRARSSASPACPATASRSCCTRFPARSRSPRSSRCRSCGTEAGRMRAGTPAAGWAWASCRRSGSGAARCRGCRSPRTRCSPRTGATWCSKGLIDFAAARRVRRASASSSYDVKCGGPRAQARSLSGGNLQKFIVGREILQQPKVLVVAQPTWGVDVGAAAFIRQALIDLRNAGTRDARDLRGAGRAVRDLRPHRGDRQGPAVAGEARRPRPTSRRSASG